MFRELNTLDISSQTLPKQHSPYKSHEKTHRFSFKVNEYDAEPQANIKEKFTNQATSPTSLLFFPSSQKTPTHPAIDVELFLSLLQVRILGISALLVGNGEILGWRRSSRGLRR